MKILEVVKYIQMQGYYTTSGTKFSGKNIFIWFKCKVLKSTTPELRCFYFANLRCAINGIFQKHTGHSTKLRLNLWQLTIAACCIGDHGVLYTRGGKWHQKRSQGCHLPPKVYKTHGPRHSRQQLFCYAMVRTYFKFSSWISSIRLLPLKLLTSHWRKYFINLRFTIFKMVHWR